jgi:hypothetical protein
MESNSAESTRIPFSISPWDNLNGKLRLGLLVVVKSREKMVTLFAAE